MKLKTTLALTILTITLAISGESNRRIPIHGTWDVDNPPHFMSDVVLREDRSYTVKNNTPEVIYVMLVEGRTWLGYFPLMPGGEQQFNAPWNLAGDTYSLDFMLLGLEDAKTLNGRHGIVVTELQ